MKLDFLSGTSGKEFACNAGDLDLIPGSGRYLEKEMAIHSSILAWKNPMDRGARGATVHEVTESDTTEQLNHHQPPSGRQKEDSVFF